MSTQDHYDVIVLGAGAAGLMCAAVAGQRGKRVLLLERTEKAGKKILISGGGRCNFTNRDALPSRYLSANPSFCISALKRYSAQDFIALVERYRIPYHEKTLGQLFCNGSAREILTMLMAECELGQVTLLLDTATQTVRRNETGYLVETSRGHFQSEKLVVATGGLSIPKMGATGFAHSLARQFDLKLIEPRPGLVPFVFAEEMRTNFTELSGIALEDVEVRAGRSRFREAMLLTHRGLSGPAMLQISSYWREGEPITINLMPDLDMASLLKERKIERPNAQLKTILGEWFPARLADRLSRSLGSHRSLHDIKDKDLAALAAELQCWTLFPTGTEGYRTAEVTLGGIDTDELSSRTLEARKVPGLYFIGEAVDVTGWLGGYNFQWAWSSAQATGTAL